MSDPKLDIKITTTADTSGAAQAQKALQGAGKAAEDAGTKTQSAGAKAKQGFDQFSKSGNDAANVISNLENVSKGGIAGIFGIANAVRSLIAIVRTAAGAAGPIGLLVTLLGTALAGAMAVFSNRSKEAGKSLDETAKAAQRLGKTSLENVRAELTALAKEASDAKSRFDELQASKDRISNQKLATDLARNAADKTISEEERVNREFALRRQSEEQDRNAELERKKFEKAQAEDVQARAKKIAEKANEDVQNTTGELQKLTSQKMEREAAQKELKELQERTRSQDFRGLTPESKADEARKLELNKLLESGRDIASEEIDEAATRVAVAIDVATTAAEAVGEATARFDRATESMQLAVQTLREVAQLRAQELTVNQTTAVQTARKVDSATPVGPADTSDLDAEITALEDKNFRSTRLGGEPEINKRLQDLKRERGDRIQSAAAASQAALQSRTRPRLGQPVQPVAYSTYAGNASDAREVGADGVIRGARTSASAASMGSDGVLRSAQAVANEAAEMSKGLDGFFRTTAGHMRASNSKMKQMQRTAEKEASRARDLRP